MGLFVYLRVPSWFRMVCLLGLCCSSSSSYVFHVWVSLTVTVFPSGTSSWSPVISLRSSLVATMTPPVCCTKVMSPMNPMNDHTSRMSLLFC